VPAPTPTAVPAACAEVSTAASVTASVSSTTASTRPSAQPVDPVSSANASTMRMGVGRSIEAHEAQPGLPSFRGTVRVFFDEPAKVTKPYEEARTIRSELEAQVHATRSELIVVSPCFVPLDHGVALFRELRERGARIVVLTNSLVSTDVVPVHSAYAPSRRPLLEMGVELNEVRPDVSSHEQRKSGLTFRRSGLHMKYFIIDRRSMFFGSFNWAPRSRNINTEIGLFPLEKKL